MIPLATIERIEDSFPTYGTNGLPLTWPAGNGAAEWLLGVPIALL
jgi:hypothetical protein